MISRVTADSLNDVWGQMAPMIIKGLSHGEGDGWTLDALLDAVRGGSMEMLVAHEGNDVLGCAILAIREYPRKTSVFVQMVAGRHGHIWSGEMIDCLESYREANSADFVEASCRPGLARYLARHGWRRKAIVMEAPR